MRVPRVRRLDAREDAHQRRLAGAVRADQRDAVAALDQQVDAVEDAGRAVGLADALQLEDGAAALGRGREGEADALALRRHLDRHHLLEHLDPALDLRRLGRLVAEPVDEHLDPRDLLVLVALGLAQALEHRVALLDVLAVVADVVGQRAQVEVGDAGDDRVEEVAIVRDEDHRVRVGREVFLEPVARVEIEMVGRLVEQEQPGPAEQQLGQRDAHLPAARERLGRLGEVVLAEAEAAQHGGDAQVDAVAVVAAEALLQLGVADQHRFVLALGHAVVAEPGLERVHLGLLAEQLGEGRCDASSSSVRPRWLSPSCGR